MLLDFLEARGNSVLGKRWHCTKEGFHTHLVEPIDFELVLAHFRVSDDVEVNLEYKFIATKSEWLAIAHSPQHHM